MTVVVGYVASPVGDAALAYGIEEAQRRHEPIAVAHSDKGGLKFTAQEVEDAESKLEKIRGTLAASGLEHEVHEFIRGNDPTTDLIEFAESLSASCIVIGVRHRTPVGKLLLGSNAQSIILRSTCPVICVKTA